MQCTFLAMLLFYSSMLNTIRARGNRKLTAHTTTSAKVIKSCFNIDNCVHWLDTDGNRIEAHAAGMLKVCVGRVAHRMFGWYTCATMMM